MFGKKRKRGVSIFQDLSQAKDDLYKNINRCFCIKKTSRSIIPFLKIPPSLTESFSKACRGKDSCSQD